MAVSAPGGKVAGLNMSRAGSTGCTTTLAGKPFLRYDKVAEIAEDHEDPRSTVTTLAHLSGGNMSRPVASCRVAVLTGCSMGPCLVMRRVPVRAVALISSDVTRPKTVTRLSPAKQKKKPTIF